MDLRVTALEVIDIRSFSNMWYWIALAVMWSTASHWVMGIPFDLIQRARKHKGDAEVDLIDLARVYSNRLLSIAQVSGFLMLAVSTFILTIIALGGFVYGNELMQAVFLLAFPMGLLGLMNLSLAQLIHTQNPDAPALVKILLRHRIYTQLLGLISIFITSLWGMYVNFQYGALGG